MLKYFESVLIIYMFAYNIPYSLYGFSATPSFLDYRDAHTKKRGNF